MWGKSSLEASVRKSRRFHQKSPKKPRSYLPEPKILRIQERHIAGENDSAIARAEKCDRHTVSKIVKGPEMAAFVAEMRARFNGFAPLALDAVEHGLTISKDTKLAIEVLKDIGVIGLTANSVVQQEDEQALEERWMGRMAMIAFEKNGIYGTNLGPQMERLESQLELRRINNKSAEEEGDDDEDNEEEDEGEF
jgi:hypothetical protein